MQWLLRVISHFVIYLIMKFFFRKSLAFEQIRKNLNRIAGLNRTRMKRRIPGIRYSDHLVDNLAIEEVNYLDQPQAKLLYIHGGGYFMGSPATFRRFTGRLAKDLGCQVFVPDYRLAPEHAFPAALEDCQKAFEFSLRQNPELPIILGGDSAGGGLSLSLLLQRRDLKMELPSSAFLISAWTDQTGSGASWKENERYDFWLSDEVRQLISPHVVGNSDPTDPYISPYFGDMSSLCPIQLFVGDREVLYNDSIDVFKKLKEAGVDAELVIGKKMQHNWLLTISYLNESKTAFRALQKFALERAKREKTSRLPQAQ